MAQPSDSSDSAPSPNITTLSGDSRTEDEQHLHRVGGSPLESASARPTGIYYPVTEGGITEVQQETINEQHNDPFSDQSHESHQASENNNHPHPPEVLSPPAVDDPVPPGDGLPPPVEEPAEELPEEQEEEPAEQEEEPGPDEQLLGGAEQVPTCTCSLIPKWTTKRWKCCTTVYGLGIAVCVVLFLITCALIGFWVDQMNKTGNTRTMWVSTMNEVYDMNTQHSTSDLYWNEVCISMADGSLPSDYHTTIQLAREERSKVETTNKTFNISGNVTVQRIQAKTGERMFYGLSGTSFDMNINITKDNIMVIYLLTDFEQADQCSKSFDKPKHAVVKSWPLSTDDENICSNVKNGIVCNINWTATETNHYYICFYIKNFVPFPHIYTAKYDLTIHLVYDNIPLKNRVTCNLTRQSDTCCTSYNNIFMELHTQTSIFVITNVSSNDSFHRGIPMEIKVSTKKRNEVMWYLVGLALVCLLLAIVLGVVATCTVYKGRHQQSRGCKCTCMCSLYGQPE